MTCPGRGKADGARRPDLTARPYPPSAPDPKPTMRVRVAGSATRCQGDRFRGRAV